MVNFPATQHGHLRRSDYTVTQLALFIGRAAYLRQCHSGLAGGAIAVERIFPTVRTVGDTGDAVAVKGCAME